ncbi:MAG: zinc ribbon domain-containing protein [Thermoplasmata archaeon]|nr:zinc ribbon domain-containing protein [Thermoplasmata archaeon]
MRELGESITHAAIARPSGRLGPLGVEAPDEDGFTLGLAAAEALPWPPDASPVQRLDLVGDFPLEAGWALPEALDLGEVTVHRSASGAASLFEALRSHPGSAPGTARLVLAVDLARIRRPPGPSHGALALAFRLGEGGGLRVDSVGTHVVSPRRGSPAKSSDVRGAPPGARPMPLLLLGEEAQLAAASERAIALGFVPIPAPPPPPGVGPAVTTLAGLALRLAYGVDNTVIEVALWVLSPDQEVSVRATELGPVAWSEAPTPGPHPLAAPPIPEAAGAPDARAEGAYVPKPRYLENLPSRWRLVAERCAHCSHLTFPARGVCASCGRADGIQAVPLARDGWTVEAVTTVRPGAQPTEFDLYAKAVGGYDVVIARSREGPRGTFQVAGPAGSAHIGDALYLPLRRLYPMEGEWRYGRKAAPLPARPRTA